MLTISIVLFVKALSLLSSLKEYLCKIGPHIIAIALQQNYPEPIELCYCNTYINMCTNHQNSKI